MPVMFNTLLREAGIDPKDVRLIRHKDKSAKKGRSPYELWRDDSAKFELYQSIQRIDNRKKFQAPYWAVFVVNFEDKTLFAGLYSVKYRGLLEEDTPMPHPDGIDLAGNCDFYDLNHLETMKDLSGKLFIDWGPGALAWVQHADRNNKAITEIHAAFREPEFPGFLNFIEPLSRLDKLPSGWITALKSASGIYLLTCPKTKEWYVGSASGVEGFWGRWQNYVETGHGDNVMLKGREPSDYQISILEVAGSSATKEQVLQMEGRWMKKLQTVEMGLNTLLAGDGTKKREKNK